jgi:hypothetical protein
LTDFRRLKGIWEESSRFTSNPQSWRFEGFLFSERKCWDSSHGRSPGLGAQTHRTPLKAGFGGVFMRINTWCEPSLPSSRGWPLRHIRRRLFIRINSRQAAGPQSRTAGLRRSMPVLTSQLASRFMRINSCALRQGRNAQLQHRQCLRIRLNSSDNPAQDAFQRARGLKFMRIDSK